MPRSSVLPGRVADVRLSTGVRLSYLEQGEPEGALEGVACGAGWSAGEKPFTGLIEGRTPVLLLRGELDAMFSRADQEALLAALPAGILREYRETGHAPHWERPREVVRDLERFLRTTLA